jgi:hypothetical protein
LFGRDSVLQFFGQPPIIAKAFEPEQLRCALCQEFFTAELPTFMLPVEPYFEMFTTVDTPTLPAAS